MKIDFIETAAALRSFLSSEIDITEDEDLQKAYTKIAKRFLTHLSAELGLKRCKLTSVKMGAGVYIVTLQALYSRKETTGIKIIITKQGRTLNFIKYYMLNGFEDESGGPAMFVDIPDLAKPVQVLREFQLTLNEHSRV